MDLLQQAIDLFLHLDTHLAEFIQAYGVWTYALLTLIIFCETGLVVTPFLPGDSLLFAAGALATIGKLDPVLLSLLLCGAAIAGDTVNYWIGVWVGPKIFSRENVRFMNRKHLQRAHAFYERHGGKTIIIARFMPIIRTFAPFVAGIGKMSYWRFISYNVIGGVTWVLAFIWVGYWFGNQPVVKENFTLVIMAIIFISVLPAFIAWLQATLRARAEARAKAATPSGPTA